MQGLQLPLGVHLSEAASFDTFHAGPNDEAATAVRGMLDDAGAPPLMLLFGPPGSGKTHLLQALTQRAADARRACAYVPLESFAAQGVDVLEGLDQADLVCLDDLDAVLADAPWRLGVLRLIDQVRAHGGRCVLSALAPPDRLPLPFADLATRLASAAVFGLKPLTDADRGRLLLERARARGLDLPEEAATLLLARLPRDVGSLLGALEQLDRAALSARRRLTVPFVQQWLRETAPPP